MSSSAIATVAWALLTVMLVYVVVSSTRRVFAIGVVLFLIPFQTVETIYASSSVLIAYAVTMILMLNGGLRVRMLPALGLIVLTYLVSFAQADRMAMKFHLSFMFQFFSCLLIFLLAYNFAWLVKRERTVVDLLIGINVLVLVYCLLQVSAGPGERFVLFGIDGLEFNRNREASDPRLVGPFSNPGSTAGYFTLMVLVLSAEAMFASGARQWLVRLVILANIIGLIATANRGAFLVLLAMFPLMLFAFRRHLGLRRVAEYSIGGFMVLAVAAAVAVTYTDFNIMFERLETVTETEAGVPQTRAVTWPAAIDKIHEKPWLGEGPYFLYKETAELLGVLRTQYDDYPHSLYLYLLRTVGIVGLVAVMWFFAQAGFVILRALRRSPKLDYEGALLRVGVIVIVAFLLDQIRLEFNRPATMDYAQFIFALIGMFVGLADRRDRSPAPAGGKEVGEGGDLPVGFSASGAKTVTAGTAPASGSCSLRTEVSSRASTHLVVAIQKSSMNLSAKSRSQF